MIFQSCLWSNSTNFPAHSNVFLVRRVTNLPSIRIRMLGRPIIVLFSASHMWLASFFFQRPQASRFLSRRLSCHAIHPTLGENSSAFECTYSVCFPDKYLESRIWNKYVYICASFLLIMQPWATEIVWLRCQVSNWLVALLSLVCPFSFPDQV